MIQKLYEYQIDQKRETPTGREINALEVVRDELESSRTKITDRDYNNPALNININIPKAAIPYLIKAIDKELDILYKELEI